MPATKRKSDGLVDAGLSKKPCTGPVAGLEPDMTLEQLQALEKEVLKLSDTTSALKDSSGNASKEANVAWTPEKIAERAEKVREICTRDIKKQMKWQPSCKQGRTKWSYTGVVPNQDVFGEVMREEKNVKPWKLKKISTSDFNETFGYVQASCRYNNLSVTGETVTVRWNPEVMTFQLSGTYGI